MLGHFHLNKAKNMSRTMVMRLVSMFHNNRSCDVTYTAYNTDAKCCGVRQGETIRPGAEIENDE